jgi:transposase
MPSEAPGRYWRFYPSSRSCSGGGTVNKARRPSDRVWMYGRGTANERALNAAGNIRREGLQSLAGGYPETYNACRE